jgi:hypothetical protein
MSFATGERVLTPHGTATVKQLPQQGGHTVFVRYDRSTISAWEDLAHVMRTTSPCPHLLDSASLCALCGTSVPRSC